MLRQLSLLVAPLVVLALAGCSAGSPSSASGSGAAPVVSSKSTTGTSNACAAPVAGAASRAVSVTGAVGQTPTVTFAKGLSVKKTQRTTVVAGTGAKAVDGSLLSVAFTMYDATTGDATPVTSAGFPGETAAQFTVSDSLYLPGLVKAMRCATVGSRTVTVADTNDMFGKVGSTGFKIGKNDDVVIVMDILAKLPTKATGAAVAPESGFPTVKLAASGKPTVKIPSSDPPSTLQLETLKKGAGGVVPSGGQVTVQYQGTLWRNGKVFDQSWGSGPTTFATASVVAGFRDAIVGQTIGSQVVVIVPPAEGYGTGGNETAGITGTDTLVFVVDILATS